MISGASRNTGSMGIRTSPVAVVSAHADGLPDARTTARTGTSAAGIAKAGLATATELASVAR